MTIKDILNYAKEAQIIYEKNLEYLREHDNGSAEMREQIEYIYGRVVAYRDIVDMIGDIKK